jgi:hypothetical protein
MTIISASLMALAWLGPWQQGNDFTATASRTGKDGALLVTGKLSLPDGAVLKLTLHRLTEQWVRGRLEAVPQEAGGGLARVDRGSFSFESAWDGPGICSITASLDESFQDPALKEALTKKPAGAAWKQASPGWEQELLPQLSGGLAELDRFVKGALDFVGECEQATATEDVWKSQRKTLLRKGATLLAQIDKSESRKLYPAAHGQIQSTVRDILSNARSFVWKDGKFSGAAAYHNKNEPEMNFRQEEFTFANFRRYVNEATGISGREFALWIVKDIRRAGRRSVHGEAVRQEARRPGVAEYAARLGEESPALAQLEEDIRENRKPR